MDRVSQINKIIDQLAPKLKDAGDLEYWKDIAPNLSDEYQAKLLEILQKEEEQLETLEK